MIPRYNATTLGGGNDYCLEQDDDGSLCRAYDVEKLEAKLAALVKAGWRFHVAQEQIVEMAAFAQALCDAEEVSQ